MVVEITKDIIEYLEMHKDALNEQSDVVVMIDEIARQCYEHHHVIYAEIDVFEYLKNCKVLENRSRRLFSALFRSAFTLKSFVDATRYRIVYSTVIENNTLKIEDGVIKLYVPIVKKFLLAQAILVCENLRDCELYIDLVKEIIREKGTNISLSIHPIHCGGSEAEATVRNEIATGECRPIACIMDSDKKKEDDRYGSSAQKAVEIFNKKKESYPIKLHVLAVRMKENLFPPEVLNLDVNIGNKEFLTALIPFQDESRFENFFKFFDFKNTVFLKNCEKIVAFKPQIEEAGIIWPNEEQITKTPDAVLIRGIGANGLDNFHRSVLKHQLDERYKRMVEHGCSKESCEKVHKDAENSYDILQYLRKPWKEDWESVEQLIIDFGIAFPETLTFAG